ncbi:MAG TPA: VOC family protein, partial [Candidatus Dojkabacteria bacterium]
MTKGLHHITAISSDPQKTYDFYTEILGLKLVKKTVNQDDTKTFHLFFGDNEGQPGMDLTFFPFQPATQGMHGTGMVNKIMLAVPMYTLDFWQKRIDKFKLNNKRENKNLNGDSYIEFEDWDGQVFQIVETDRINPDYKLFETKEIQEDQAIRNFYGIEIDVQIKDPTSMVLTDILEYKKIKEKDEISLFENMNSTFANLIFLNSELNSRGINAAGTVHHVAFRVKDEKEQLKIRNKVIHSEILPTPVIDRFYFKSVYFREPGGVLFELATEGPGFTADEHKSELGKNLSLPPFLEAERELIEKNLVPINPSTNVLEKSHMNSLFKFFEINNKSEKTIVLLHGTGGDEYDLLSLFDEELFRNSNIISLRGNVIESGMYRFFRRFKFGEFDQENIKEEARKIKEFIEIYKKINPKVSEIIFAGFSNGANMILNVMILYPDLVKKAALLHPMITL